NNIGRIKDEETFRFCTYLLKEMKFDYGAIVVPFVYNENKEIKKAAYYSLGQLENKRDYVDTFIVGLQDSSNKVIHAALQAVNGIKEKKLLPHYKMIAEKFPKEQDYILSNLNLNLKVFGLSATTIKSINIDAINEKKWFEFWK
ncbi:SMI1/KNR4 family protein, partial [Flavobacterium sp. LBUM151]